MIRDLLDDWLGRFVLLLMVGTIALIPLSIWVIVKDGQEWERFRVERNCRVVAHVRGGVKTGTGITTGGKVAIVTVPEPDKTGWLCDDGVTYYR